MSRTSNSRCSRPLARRAVMLSAFGLTLAPAAAGQCEIPSWNALPSPPTALTARAGEGVFDTARGRFVLFGGFTTQNTRETWEFGNGVWTLASTDGPSARRGSGLVYDSARHRVLLFGGFDTVDQNDLWSWDGVAWTKLNPGGTPPAPRDAMAMAYDEIRDRVVVFGGVAPNYFFGDTFEYDPKNNVWQQVSSTGPFPRGYMHACYDPTRGRTVMFGGGGDQKNQQLHDTWEWNGTSWKHVTSEGPSSRRLYTMAYNGARGRVMLFGGYTDANPPVFSGDTWEWDGASWAQLAVGGPPPRTVAFAGYDPAAARIVLFGGANQQGSLRDLWSFTAPPLVAEQSNDLLMCPQGIAEFWVTPAGTGTFTYSWQIEAAAGVWSAVPEGSAPGLGTVEGARTAKMTISSLDPAVSGRRFRCVLAAVTGACGSVQTIAVTLKICRTDIDCNGFVDVFDFVAFVNAFESGDPRADFNGDGFIDIFDFNDFVTAFEAGC